MHLDVESVSVNYVKKAYALDHVSLRLRPGITGLLGPNGAGKSTLMRILASISRPSSGRVLWNGEDICSRPDRLRSVLGYLPQDFGVYPHLNALEFLDYLAAVKGIPASTARKRIAELLEVLNLTSAARRPLGGYSGGMRQRVGIAQALLNDPLLLIVDEPTAGLDPEERIQLRNVLSELSGQRIVIISTHVVSDIEVIATEIAILANGQVVASETPGRLLDAAKGRIWEMAADNSDLPMLRQQLQITNITHHPGGIHVRIISEVAPSDSARCVAPSLEDAYLATLNRQKKAEITLQEIS